MVSKIIHRKAAYRLEYLHSLQDDLKKIADELDLDFNWLLNRLCNFSITYDSSKNTQNTPLSADWLNLFSVYSNVICRGTPTTPSLFIEKILTAKINNQVPFQKTSDERIIAFRDQLTGQNKEKWLNYLLQAHLANDYRCNSAHGNFESDEEKEFLNLVSKEIGGIVFQTIECQRPFSSINESIENTEFYDQRVDFSLETKDNKLIFEIDGKQHLEENQRELDNKRRIYLESKNWKVIRIPAKNVRQNQIYEALEKIKKVYSTDPFLTSIQKLFKKTICNEEMGQAAVGLVLIPIGIARIQWTLTWAILKGILNLDKSVIKIAIVEKDLPCGKLALIDFIKSISCLKTLADIEKPLPKFEITIIGNDDFDSFNDNVFEDYNEDLVFQIPGKQNIKTILQNNFDLILKSSILHIGPDAQKNWGAYNNCVSINSVFSPRGNPNRLCSASPIKYRLNKEKQEVLRYFLQWIFRKNDFLEGQLEILERALVNKDVIGLLPTGGGKSLCYQLSALLQPGMTIIIDPLISLMQDQVSNLKELQIDAIDYISSNLSASKKTEVLERMVQGYFLMLFISPERFQIQSFREKLRELSFHKLIPYVVIDEAHCISEWGHDFRPAYLRLATVARQICVHNSFKPTILGLTGTASWVVLSDIQRESDINEAEAIITPKTFDREELEYEVVRCPSSEKSSTLISKILELPQKFNLSSDAFFSNHNGGIIFCPHVNGSYGTQEVASKIHQKLHDLIPKIKTYSGKPPRLASQEDWKKIKSDNQKAFKNSKVQLMVATKAFGMGIDKSNIRFTIHYNIPTSLEAFYQEAGRAGRDKKKAICTIIFSGDMKNWKELNTDKVSIEKIVDANQKVSFPEQDDIHRMLYLHGCSWTGIETEFQNIMSLFRERIAPAIEKLEFDETGKILIPFRVNFGKIVETQNGIEKILYRLSILGLISDYTLDYNSKQFEVKIVPCSDESIKSRLLQYFGRYKPPEYKVIASKKIDSSEGQTVLEKCVRVMLDFVYEEIEKKRRRAIFHMAEVAETATDEDPFRDQLFNYLEKSEFTQMLAEIVTKIDPLEWVKIAQKVDDIDSARHLLGGCRRALESYPDHSGLLLLSSYSRLIIPKLTASTAFDEFQRAIKSLAKLAEKEDSIKAIAIFLEMIKQIRPSLMDKFCYIVLEEFPQRKVARITLENLEITDESAMFALKILLESSLQKTRKVRTHILGCETS